MLIELLPTIGDALAAGGRAILSGILASERTMMIDALDARGLARRRRNRRGRMVERDGRAAIATFYCGRPLARGRIGDARATTCRASPARAQRLGDGDAVQLTDGGGHLAAATVRLRGRATSSSSMSSVASVARQPAIHLRAPVADRDRMLWLAEKATELEVSSWQAVQFRRSASVTPRGEGAGFSTKRARSNDLRARAIGWCVAAVDASRIPM